MSSLQHRDQTLERASLDLAVHVAAAAARAADAIGRGVRLEEGRDIKIDADFESDRIIHEEIARQSPLPILSEESESASLPGGYRWIVDPVDGSLNFARGIPMACVSIGLWFDDEPVVGVIHDLFRDEVYSGVVGEGAWLNGRAMRVSGIRELTRAVLVTGLPGTGAHAADKLQRFVVRADAYKKVRCLGSAALMLAYVACGRADAYAEDGIALWDVAAGMALVRAAGGAVRISVPAGAGEHRFDLEADNGLLPAVNPQAG